MCRRDPKYILKTYNNMLDSGDALVRQFLERDRKADARFYATSMIYDAYYTLNKDGFVCHINRSEAAGLLPPLLCVGQVRAR